MIFQPEIYIACLDCGHHGSQPLPEVVYLTGVPACPQCGRRNAPKRKSPLQEKLLQWIYRDTGAGQSWFCPTNLPQWARHSPNLCFTLFINGRLVRAKDGSGFVYKPHYIESHAIREENQRRAATGAKERLHATRLAPVSVLSEP